MTRCASGASTLTGGGFESLLGTRQFRKPVFLTGFFQLLWKTRAWQKALSRSALRNYNAGSLPRWRGGERASFRCPVSQGVGGSSPSGHQFFCEGRSKDRHFCIHQARCTNSGLQAGSDWPDHLILSRRRESNIPDSRAERMAPEDGLVALRTGRHHINGDLKQISSMRCR